MFTKNYDGTYLPPVLDEYDGDDFNRDISRVTLVSFLPPTNAKKKVFDRFWETIGVLPPNYRGDIEVAITEIDDLHDEDGFTQQVFGIHTNNILSHDVYVKPFFGELKHKKKGSNYQLIVEGLQNYHTIEDAIDHYRYMLCQEMSNTSALNRIDADRISMRPYYSATSLAPIPQKIVYTDDIEDVADPLTHTRMQSSSAIYPILANAYDYFVDLFEIDANTKSIRKLNTGEFQDAYDIKPSNAIWQPQMHLRNRHYGRY